MEKRLLEHRISRIEFSSHSLRVLGKRWTSSAYQKHSFIYRHPWTSHEKQRNEYRVRMGGWNTIFVSYHKCHSQRWKRNEKFFHQSQTKGREKKIVKLLQIFMSLSFLFVLESSQKGWVRAGSLEMPWTLVERMIMTTRIWRTPIRFAINSTSNYSPSSLNWHIKFVTADLCLWHFVFKRKLLSSERWRENCL